MAGRWRFEPVKVALSDSPRQADRVADRFSTSISRYLSDTLTECSTDTISYETIASLQIETSACQWGEHSLICNQWSVSPPIRCNFGRGSCPGIALNRPTRTRSRFVQLQTARSDWNSPIADTLQASSASYRLEWTTDQITLKLCLFRHVQNTST